MTVRTIAAVALVAVTACGEGREPRAEPAAPPPPAGAGAEAHHWVANPTDATLALAADTLLVTTGPHVIAWDAAAGELSPPYEVAATLRKRSGRLHEAVGLIFGGSALDGAEGAQGYSYFMVRGDGSFLVKQRRGAETPVVLDWTRHPAIRRDEAQGGRPNDLRVVVTDTTVAFEVNGAEVARVPAADLALRGRAGVRVSHDVELTVAGFRAGALP